MAALLALPSLPTGSGSGTIVIACILAFVYNCADGLDGLRFPASICAWVGAAACVAGTVLFGMTTNDWYTLACSGGVCSATVCYTTSSGLIFCQLVYFAGACTVLLGVSFFLALFMGLTTVMTE